jgi:hypothetical protein
MIEEIDSLLTRTTSMLLDIPKNKTPIDYINDLLIKKVDLQNTMKKRLTKSLIELNDIKKTTASLSYHKQCLFRMHYLEDKKWEDICIAWMQRKTNSSDT